MGTCKKIKSKNLSSSIVSCWFLVYEVQKAAVCRCSSKQVFLKICNIHRKTAVLESFFNKVAGLKDCHFIKKRVQPRSFSVNIEKFLRIAFL